MSLHLVCVFTIMRSSRPRQKHHEIEQSSAPATSSKAAGGRGRRAKCEAPSRAMLQIPGDRSTASKRRVRWHKRSASTGSRQETTDVMLKVPSNNKITRARSEERLLLTNENRVECPPFQVWRRGSCPMEVHDASEGTPPKTQLGVAELFARQMLQYSYPLVTPPPIVVEDPPSSDDAAGDERFVAATSSRRRRSPKLNGSSGSSGSGSSGNLGAKSAPPTPHGDRLQPGGPGGTFPAPTPTTPVSESPPAADIPPRSPSFSKNEKQALKHLSTSTPSMTAAGPSESEPPVITPPGSSKARQKKFHRHFKQVPPEERVLNYYSCALVSDILLQGHLYITKNYFAFYSNVFGYVTKLLIPTASVLKVSKEKTAKIIPNAVGIATMHEKHVFGSLLSRDATYKLMIQVWKNATEPEECIIQPKLEIEAKDEEQVSSVSVDAAIVDDEDSSLSGSGNDDSAIERSCSPTPIDTPTDMAALSESKRSIYTSRIRDVPDSSKYSENRQHRVATVTKVNGTPVPMDRILIQEPPRVQTSLPRPTILLIFSTAILVLLFISAGFLLFRISAIQAQFSSHPVISSSGDIYQEILKWQIQLHSKSSVEVQQFLSNNLDQISKVRQSLEALSMILVTESEERLRYRPPPPPPSSADDAS